MDLDGKNVVVTGASGGIGERIAREFAGSGCNVASVARSHGKLDAIAKEIGGHVVVADLSTADGVDGLVDTCIETLGHIDVWVNNAGAETSDAFVATDRADVRALARLNFEAPLLLTRDVVHHMVNRGSGHVVQMSSVAGAIPFPGLTSYAGTKAGLTHFTESLRVELSRTNVNFTVVSPGAVDTPMWDRLDTTDAYSAPALKRFRQLFFLPKLSPDQIAAATVEAVAKEKRHVRLPARYGMYHLLSNAPRRMVEAALIGVKLPVKT